MNSLNASLCWFEMKKHHLFVQGSQGSGQMPYILRTVWRNRDPVLGTEPQSYHCLVISRASFQALKCMQMVNRNMLCYAILMKNLHSSLLPDLGKANTTLWSRLPDSRCWSEREMNNKQLCMLSIQCNHCWLHDKARRTTDNHIPPTPSG